MNASQLCLCKYECLKTIRCIVKQTNKQKHSKQGRVWSARFPWSYTAYIRSFLKCIWSFSLFTIQNASPIIATTNSRVHGAIANAK